MKMHIASMPANKRNATSSAMHKTHGETLLERKYLVLNGQQTMTCIVKISLTTKSNAERHLSGRKDYALCLDFKN